LYISYSFSGAVRDFCGSSTVYVYTPETKTPAIDRQIMNNTSRASGDLDSDKGITILVFFLFSGNTYKDEHFGIKAGNIFQPGRSRKTRPVPVSPPLSDYRTTLNQSPLSASGAISSPYIPSTCQPPCM
jgi:hypothetical protein